MYSKCYSEVILINWKPFVVFSTVAHVPQVVNMARGMSMKEARVFSAPGKFWTITTILLHIIAITILIVTNMDTIRSIF